MQESHSTVSPTPRADEAGGEGGADGYAQMDDINIPLVAVAVGLFAVTLAVVIVGLQAWFKNADARELQGKTLAQEDPRTDLGKLLAAQRAELHDGPNALRDAAPAPAPAPTTATATAAASMAATATAQASQPARKWIPIDAAMRMVAREYSGGAKP